MSPKGVYDRGIKTEDVSGVAIQEKPEVKVERVRQYSPREDHKGQGHPLCLGCQHREDMHYTERRWTETKFGKNLQGDFVQVEVQHREPVYSGAKPCQHACLCKAYE